MRQLNKKNESDENLETQRKNQLKKIVALNRSRDKGRHQQMPNIRNSTSII